MYLSLKVGHIYFDLFSKSVLAARLYVTAKRDKLEK